MLLAQVSISFQSLPLLPTSKLALLVLTPWWVVLCTFQDLVGLSNELFCETGSFSCSLKSHKFYQPEVLRFYFPALDSWVVQSVSIPSLSSWFIHGQVWDHLLCQPWPFLPWSSSHFLALSPLHPSCLSLPLLLVWMNVSFLTLGCQTQTHRHYSKTT